MAEVFAGLGEILSKAYDALIGILPASVQAFLAFFILAVIIVIYAAFVWKFYQSVGRKDILKLNLKEYNKAKHPVMTKFIAAFFYTIEYIFIAPFAIFIWFAFFTIFLLLLTENLPAGTVLILSATTIAAIRIISYYNENLSKDVAKLIPFTLLATSLLNPGFFSVERILGQIKDIPTLFDKIFIYLAFIILLELVLRGFDFIFSMFNLEDEKLKVKEED